MQTDAQTLPPGCKSACRGCHHRYLSPAQSLAQKQAWLARVLAPWADRLAPVQAGRQRLGYRGRATLACEWRAGRWHVGMPLRGQVLDIRDCPVHTPTLRKVLNRLAPALPPAADGFPLAWCVANGAQLTLVLKTAARPDTAWLDGLWPGLQAAGIEGLWLNLHPSAGRRLFHKRGWRLVAGTPFSNDATGCRHGPAGFRQLIPALHQASLDVAEEFLAPGTGELAGHLVLDLYCGLGASLARWCARGAETIGVELSGEACAQARHNAPGATVLRGGCTQRIPQLRAGIEPYPPARRLAYLNPPRAGLDAPVQDWIAREAKPARIAMLACSAAPLARDLEALQAAGYRVDRLLPWDFFPNTDHVEVLALLRRKV